MSQKWYPLLSLFRYAEKRELFLITIGLISTVLSSWCSPTLYVIFGNIIHIFSEFQSNKTITIVDFPFYDNFYSLRKVSTEDNILLKDEFMIKVEYFSIFLTLIGIFYIITSYLSVLCFELSAHSQILNIKYKLFSSILHRSFEWFDHENSQKESSKTNISDCKNYDGFKTNEFSTRISSDLKSIERGMNENLCLFIYFTSSIIANLSYALYFGWKLALVIFAITPIITFSSAMLTKVQSSFVRKEMKAYGKAGSFANEIFSSILTVFAFNGQNKALTEYRNKLEPTRKMFLKRSLLNAAGTSISWAAIYCGLALGLYYGVYLCKTEHDSYSIGTIVLVFWCSAAVGWNLGYAAPYMEYIRIACTVANVLYKNIQNKNNFEKKKFFNISFAPTIEFRNVHFSYETRIQDKIFSGLNLFIDAGQTVAIVGTTGSGKSTILQLLQRFYSLHSGQILIDKKDICNFDSECLRELFGVVGQEPILFDMTIYENIRLGANDKNFNRITLDDVILAAKEANAHDFISQLPDKYQTKVGQSGAQLSGGQKQRIALARALLKNPKILLLDEATSALDAQSERLVQNALEKASKYRTTVIIAHRLSTIIHADKIICLGNDGNIVEYGNHKELLQKNGFYKRLIKNQLEKIDSFDEYSKIEQQELIRIAINDKKYCLEDNEIIVNEDEIKNDKNKWITGRLIKMLFGYKLITILAVINAILFGLCIPGYALIFGNFVSDVFVDKFEDIKVENAQIYSIQFIYLAIYAFITYSIQSILFSIASEKLTRKLRLNTFWAILEHDVSWFDKNSPGSICSKLSEYPNDIQTAIGPKTAMFCQAFSTLLISISVGFYCSWELSMITIWFVPIIAISSNSTASILGDQSNKEREQNAQAASIAAEALTTSGVRTIKTLHKEDYFIEKYKKELLSNEENFIKTTNKKSFLIAIALATPSLAYAVSFYYGGLLISNDRLKVSHFLQVVEAMIFGAIVFGQACFFSSDFARAKTAAEELFDLIDWAREKTLYDKIPRFGSSNYLIGYALNNCRGDIEFVDVDFVYPNRPKAQILKNFSLKILSGTRVALVGSSGCGKSTILQLLLRFYSPNRGKILLDGVNIAELSRTWLRSNISFVSQEPTLFSSTIRENISYGMNEKEDEIKIEDIHDVACKACIDSFINELPEKYETHICSSLISGGQKQRIAIARTLLKKSPILLFDEATSALDSESEKYIQTSINNAICGRTAIIVAHRLSTIKNVERIIFIENGQVIEDGKHEQLLQLKGKYYKMWKSQFNNI